MEMESATNSKWQVAQTRQRVTTKKALPMTMALVCCRTNAASAAVPAFWRVHVVAMARSLNRATIAMATALRMQTAMAFVMNLRFQAVQLLMPATTTSKLQMTTVLAYLLLPAPTVVVSA